MKIVMLCDLYAESLQYQENLLAKYYIKHKHQVTVIASTFNSAFDYYNFSYDKSKPGSVTFDGQAKIIKLPYSLNILNRLRKFAGVLDILEEESPDLIFIHNVHLNCTDAIRYVKKNAGCRLIMDFHSDSSNSGRNWLSVKVLHGIIRRYYLKKILKHIDKVFVVTPGGFKFLYDCYGVPYEKMELLPLGSDTDLAKDVLKSNTRDRIRNGLGIPSEDIVIFSGGKLKQDKKVELLIDAFFKINNPSLHIILVGDSGEAEANYKKALEKMVANNVNVHFIGWVSGQEVYKYMSASDLAVFPASQSVLWQQAISIGLPLIVGQVGVQDSSYLNVNSNVITIPEHELTGDKIADAIQGIIQSTESLGKFKSLAVAAIEHPYINYDKIILQTLKVKSS